MPPNIETILSARPLLIMLDYDGTLTPIVSHFQDAQIAPERLDFLRQLAHLPQVQLAIVSGRSVSQLLLFLAPLVGEPLLLSGLHGGEIFDLKNQAYLEEPSPDFKTAITALKSCLTTQGVDQLPGIELEDKGFSLGLHYRHASAQNAQLALNALKEGLITEGLAMAFILRPGKQLLEAVPKGFNKGIAVNHLLVLATQRFCEQPALVYIGDDITDFDAFRSVNTFAQGANAYVGSQLPDSSPSVSTILPDVPAVYAFLTQHLL